MKVKFNIKQFRDMGVDQEQKVLKGASAMMVGEALGHDMFVDLTSLEQLVDLGNANDKGVKARFTHPGMCSTGLGKLLGKAKNFSLEGDKARFDLHFAEFAATSPKGNLRDHILAVAEEQPEDIGFSVVIGLHLIFKDGDGNEFTAPPTDGVVLDDNGNPAKFIRVDKLIAVDIVDEPAANEDGIFGENSELFEGTTSELAEAGFSMLDNLAKSGVAVDAEMLEGFVKSYCEARQLNKPQEIPAINGDNEMTLFELAEKYPQHMPLIRELSDKGEDGEAIEAFIANLEADEAHAELVSKLETAEAELATANEEIARLSAEIAGLSQANDEVSDQIDDLRELSDPEVTDPGNAQEGESLDELSQSELDKLSGKERAAYHNRRNEAK